MTELDFDKTLEEIALKRLGIGTLEERGMDSLDFHDVSAMSIKLALKDAYVAGFNNGRISEQKKINTVLKMKKWGF